MKELGGEIGRRNWGNELGENSGKELGGGIAKRNWEEELGGGIGRRN